MSINHLQGSPSAIAVAKPLSNSFQTSSKEHPSEPSKITGIIIGLLGRENINGFTKTENIILENVMSRVRDMHIASITTIERLRFPILPSDLVFNISTDYLDKKSVSSFNVAAVINRKEAIRRKNDTAAKKICEIENSEECRKLFAQILNSKSLTSFTKLDSIKFKLRREVFYFDIAKDQIDFADKLVAELEKQFAGDETLNKLKTSIKDTKNLEISQIAKANAINAAIISGLNSKEYLKKAANSLDLSKTKLQKMCQQADKLPNMEVLKLDFSIESTNSIVTFVEGIRKFYIAEAQIDLAKAQIDFADKLVAELETQFPNNRILEIIKEQLENIKNDQTLTLIEKAEIINNTIVDYLDADNSDNPLKYRVRCLNLSSKNLKAILPCISEFQNLEELLLDNNRLTELPDSICRLTNLYLLNLRCNQLIKLPGSIGGLINLNELYLNDNRLAELPDSMGGLINLRELYLHNNQLIVLPDSMGGLTNLQQLYLNKNQLVKLPDSMGGLINLRELYLHNNQLTILPDSIGGLINLSLLYLNKNKLIVLPKSIAHLIRLWQLDLRCNRLTELPDSIAHLTNLGILNVGYNQLIKLPDSIGGLTNLQQLYLHNNQLIALPDSICSLKKLRDLELYNNQFTNIPNHLHELSRSAKISF